MKKLITIALFCIILSTLFTSCGNGLAITKRHYTKGYYVDYTPKVHQEKATEKKSQPIVNLPTQQIAPLLVSNDKSYTSNLKTAKTVIVVKDKKVQSKITPQKTTIQAIKDKPIVANEYVAAHTEQVAPVSQYNNENGHSLLWLVVVIILILWLLGILAGGLGLGGLLNILLLVALILFILWLLRVV